MIDGSHASMWRPGRDHTASIWDLLGGAAALLPGSPRVLVLGLGAGSALRVVRSLRPRAHLEAVELSAEVVAAAREGFELDALGARVHVADAREWLRAVHPDRRFDLVIDDVYDGSSGALSKPHGWPTALRRAWRLVAPGGLLVVNLLSAPEEFLVRGLPCAGALRLEHEKYENRVLWLPRGRLLRPRELKPALARHALLEPVLAWTTVTALSERT